MPSEIAGASLYQALLAVQEEDGELLRPGIAETAIKGLSVIGASPELAGSEVELADNPRRDGLRRVLGALSDEFAFIVIDTPPSLSLLTVNSLVAANRLIIPVQCEYFGARRIGTIAANNGKNSPFP